MKKFLLFLTYIGKNKTKKMNSDDYIQLLLGNGYVSKYSKKSDYYMVDPPHDNPMILHDINDKTYRQNAGAPSYYLLTQSVLSSSTQQQQLYPSFQQQPQIGGDQIQKKKKTRKRKRNSYKNLSEFY